MPDILICLPPIDPAGEQRCFRVPMMVNVPRLPVDPNPPDPLRDLQVLATIEALSAHLSDGAAAGIVGAVSEGMAQVQKGLAEGMTVARAGG